MTKDIQNNTNYSDLESVISIFDRENFYDISPAKRHSIAEKSHKLMTEGMSSFDGVQKYAAIQYQKFLEQKMELENQFGPPPPYDGIAHDSNHNTVFAESALNSNDSGGHAEDIITRPESLQNIEITTLRAFDYRNRYIPAYDCTGDSQQMPNPASQHNPATGFFYLTQHLIPLAQHIVLLPASPIAPPITSFYTKRDVTQESSQPPLLTYFDKDGEFRNLNINDQESMQQALNILTGKEYSIPTQEEAVAKLGSQEGVIETMPVLQYKNKHAPGYQTLAPNSEDHIQGITITGFLQNYAGERNWQIDVAMTNQTQESTLQAASIGPQEPTLKESPEGEKSPSQQHSESNNKNFMKKAFESLASRLLPKNAVEKPKVVNLYEEYQRDCCSVRGI